MSATVPRHAWSSHSEPDSVIYFFFPGASSPHLTTRASWKTGRPSTPHAARRLQSNHSPPPPHACAISSCSSFPPAPFVRIQESHLSTSASDNVTRRPSLVATEEWKARGTQRAVRLRAFLCAVSGGRLTMLWARGGPLFGFSKCDGNHPPPLLAAADISLDRRPPTTSQLSKRDGALLPPSHFPYPVPRINHREQIAATAVFMQFAATLPPSLSPSTPLFSPSPPVPPAFSTALWRTHREAAGGGALHLPRPANNPSAISSYAKNEARVGRRARTRCSWASWCWAIKGSRCTNRCLESPT